MMKMIKALQASLILLAFSLGTGSMALAEEPSTFVMTGTIHQLDRVNARLIVDDMTYELDRQAKILTPGGQEADYLSLGEGTRIEFQIVPMLHRPHLGGRIIKIQLLR